MDFRLPFLVVIAVVIGVQCNERTESQTSKIDNQLTLSDDGFGEDKRGHIFRYGRANVFRYGKRAPSVFRYGKRASVFRYGKRDNEDFDDRVETLFPKRIFRYGKRISDELTDNNYDWDPEAEAFQLGNNKRMVFRYGKRGEDFGEEEEEDEGKLLIEKSHKAGEVIKEKDEKRPIFRYGRSAKLPNVPFRFGDE